jgi:hypothetical protein
MVAESGHVDPQRPCLGWQGLVGELQSVLADSTVEHPGAQA